MVGKGSISHNRRTFTAENVDAVRTKNNVVFRSDNIKQVYSDLFGAALQQYNDKQTRKDRRIPDYYEKIRTSKQEKLFHEVIFQIGNKDDMNIRDENGTLAKAILTEFMDSFQERNPQLRVFSTHLHMDEETPHLHIDFVPFTTGSKRGLETRVSLKKALAQQGFVGGSRSETEWNKWIQAEKKELSAVMERHGVEWKQLGTNNPHLSVLEYKKQERTKEVEALEAEVNRIESKLKDLHDSEDYVSLNVDKYYTSAEWQVPTVLPMMGAKGYRERLVIPLVNNLKAVIKTVVSQYLHLKNSYKELMQNVSNMKKEIKSLNSHIKRAMFERGQFEEKAEDLDRLVDVIGKDKAESILNKPVPERTKTTRGWMER
ncbi:plasmid recombination protein [Vallitalea guaymasensis]|uniref:Plasmid recombination protein n=2 Tax=Vallitalea guaymasensis TaxID=1185412 RepID=A0A8J8SEF5_9FIRM|nr:plasmid recombination protein [Vallitalea guaymasensis]